MSLRRTEILTASNGVSINFIIHGGVSNKKLSVLKLWRKAFTSLRYTDIFTVSNRVFNIFDVIIGVSHNKLSLHKSWRKTFMSLRHTEILTILNGVSINFKKRTEYIVIN